MIDLLEQILEELKGIRADMKANNDASEKWAQEQAEYQRKVMAEAIERGRRLELRGIPMRTSN